MRIGILTGGGDCPGLNAVIRAVGTTLIRPRPRDRRPSAKVGAGSSTGSSRRSSAQDISGILPRGGTILGTTRTNPYQDRGRRRSRAHELRGRAARRARGDRRRGHARRRSALYRDHGFPVVGVPKTIDNDLSGTDYTFGFDTAVTIATEAIDRLHTTAESHNRVMVVEVMGRHTGWIAVMSGIAGGADAILIPEQPITVEAACRQLVKRHEAGKDFSIVVVSEGLRAHVRVRRAQARRRRGARHRSVRSCASSAASATRSRGRSRSAPASRPGSPCSGTSSAAAPDAARPRARDALRAQGRRPRRRGQLRAMAALHGDAIVDISLEEATAS